ncbi:MAG: NAD(P)-binding domain-containing protein [Myxococcales bacterium]
MTKALSRANAKVGIVGAGPYGLASAAHLRAAGVEPTVYGEPMEFWAEQMPKGMFLRSPRCASQISDPDREWTLDRFESEAGLAPGSPIPLERFVAYGRWFQQKAVPNLLRTSVQRMKLAPEGFRLVAGREQAFFEKIVVAAGIRFFPRRLAQFAGLERLTSHTVDHKDLSVFAGMKVCVIGGGQSAFESAALLSEAGAEVEVVVRAEAVHKLGQRFQWLKSEANPLRPLLYHPTDVGPPGLNWINATPALFRSLPRTWQDRIAYRSIRPAMSSWLPSRLGRVKVTLGRTVSSARVDGGRLELELDDGTRRVADHLMQATGYQVDVSSYPFLAPEILARLRTEDGYPVLSSGFECSVPGLYFVGAPAARSFGPLCRFVSGTDYTARTLTHDVVRAVRGPAWRRPATIGPVAEPSREAL